MFKHLTGQHRRAVRASSLILFSANLLAFIAVWKMGWSFYDLLVLYWTEVIVIGGINILRMILINPRESTMGSHLLKIAYVPFFAGHFGLFCVGIGLGLQIVFGKENFEVENQILQMLAGKSQMVFWPLVISHLFSFFWIYVAQREYRRATILRRMFAPYFRVFPFLLFVVGASYACLRYEIPNWGLLALVAGKALIDLITHTVFHFRMLNQPEERPIITVRD